MNRGHSWQILLLLFLLGVLGCSFSPDCDSEPSDPRKRFAIHALWDRNQLIIEQTIEGGLFEPAEDFENAIAFFEDLTGIQSNTGTTLGRWPDPSLPQTLDDWEAWYRAHRCSIYWDDELQAPCIKAMETVKNDTVRCAERHRKQLGNLTENELG